MKIIQVKSVVKEFFNAHIASPLKISTIQANHDGWHVIVEVLEDREYLIEHARDEIIGVYEVQVNRDLEIISYARKTTRVRGAVESNEQ